MKECDTVYLYYSMVPCRRNATSRVSRDGITNSSTVTPSVKTLTFRELTDVDIADASSCCQHARYGSLRTAKDVRDGMDVTVFSYCTQSTQTDDCSSKCHPTLHTCTERSVVSLAYRPKNTASRVTRDFHLLSKNAMASCLNSSVAVSLDSSITSWTTLG